MTDTVNPDRGSASAEEVAYRLLVGMAAAEGKHTWAAGGVTYIRADKDWLLSQYISCVTAVKRRRVE